MKLSDKLRAERADLLEKMQAIATAAKGAELTGDDAAEFDRLEAAIKTLDGRIVRQHAAEEAVRGSEPSAPALIDNDGNRHLTLRTGDMLASRHRSPMLSAETLGAGSLGAVLRGLSTGRWGERGALQRALGESTLPGGGYAVPAPLAAQWLDAVRAASVMVKAGTLTLPMTANTLRVAGIQTDPVPTSRKENTAVAQSDPTFRAVDFKARSYGVIVSASLELLADSPNAETIIEQSLIGAMALTMDQAALNGDGSTAGNLDNVLGLLNVAGLTAAPAASQNNYDDTLAMIGTIRGANHEPSVSIMQPQLATLFATLKTGIAGDQTSLVAPADVSALTRLQSTSMPAATTVMGDFTKGAIGLREMLTLEATRTGGTSFAMAQVEIRALMRFDYQPLYLSAFGKITGQAPATVPSP